METAAAPAAATPISAAATPASTTLFLAKGTDATASNLGNAAAGGLAWAIDNELALLAETSRGARGQDLAASLSPLLTKLSRDKFFADLG